MRALTPVEVYDAARKQCPGLGLVSVYRTLEKLEQLGSGSACPPNQGLPGLRQNGGWTPASTGLSKLWQGDFI